MYAAIAAAAKQVEKKVDFVVPVGTAVMNMKSSYLNDLQVDAGDYFTDGSDLNELGKLVASCTWYSKLSGKKLTDLNFTDAFLVDLSAADCAGTPEQASPVNRSAAVRSVRERDAEIPVLYFFLRSWKKILAKSNGLCYNRRKVLGVSRARFLPVDGKFDTCVPRHRSPPASGSRCFHTYQRRRDPAITRGAKHTGRGRTL